MINDFHGKNFFLDNFYVAPFVDKNGLRWETTEHFFQAHKSTNNRNFFTINESYSPARAKFLGRSIELRKDWNDIKFDIMEQALRYKFDQHPELRNKLIDTGDNELIEGNTWHDNIWGDCYCDECRNIKGQNHLGKLLMKIRKEYKERKNET